MRIGVLGTGVVGHALADGFTRLGHDVRMGARAANNPAATAWAEAAGAPERAGDFRSVAAWGELVVNATNGGASVEVLSALTDELAEKVLIDPSNPLDFSGGFPPRLFVSNDDSLAEHIQRALPETQVVKALNTLAADLMLNPDLLSAPSDLFVAGNDGAAKDVVRQLLVQAGWLDANIHDLGGLEAARGTEMWLPLWLRFMSATGSGAFNPHIVR